MSINNPNFIDIYREFHNVLLSCSLDTLLYLQSALKDGCMAQILVSMEIRDRTEGGVNNATLFY